MATRQKQDGGGGDTQNDYSRKVSLVQRVLSDPALFPDEFRSWIVRMLYGNVNFTLTSGQLPAIEAHHLVGNTGEVAFSGAWVNFGGANEPARYWKDYTGIVHLGGTVKSGVIPGNIFVLPAGYRPQYTHIFSVVSNDLFALVTVAPDGSVKANSGNNTYVSLSGITFRQFA